MRIRGSRRGRAAFVVGALAAGAAWVGCLGPRPATDPVIGDPEEDLAHPARMWDGEFESHGAGLNAIAYVATGRGPHPTVILLHGFPGNEQNLDLAQALRRGGWNVVFFHYRGSWGSGGRFGFVHAIEDALAVIDQVRAPRFAAANRVDPERIVLVGHSMGGLVALAAAADRPASEVHCVVGLAAADLSRRATPDLDSPAARETAAILGAMSRARLAGTSGEALMAEISAEGDRLDPITYAPALVDRPVLLVAGSRDQSVDILDQQAIFEAIGEAGTGTGRARLVILDADHAFSSSRIAVSRQVLGFLDEACR